MKVAYYAHVGAPTGYGRSARETCQAMLTAGIDLKIRPLGQSVDDMADLLTKTGHQELVKFLSSSDELDGADALIINALPFECRRIAEHLGAELLDRIPRVIAQTTWEAETPPTPEVFEWWSWFGQVWTPNNWFAKQPAPLRHAVIPTAFDETRAWRQDPRTDGPYRFYYIGFADVRKNPQGVVRTFCYTFRPDQNVELVLHCPGLDQVAFQNLLLSTALHPDKMPRIKLSNEWLPDVGVEQLHINGDCFVSAARGEAWNLPAFDAMLFNRHVIVPAGQGSDDYLYITSAQRYGSTLAPAFGNVQATRTDKGMKLSMTTPQGLDCKSLWFEPDLSQLSKRMHEAFVTAKRSISVDREELAARFGRKAVGKAILAELKR